jgi:thiamine kinase-like enzyme
MELVKGVTLENRWKSLSKQERIKVCEQLRAILLELRKLQQDPKDQFLGHINRQPLLDIVFTDNTKPPAGPFASVKEFPDWLSYLTKRGKEIHWPDPSLIPDPFRDLLPDDSPITFTHDDLHPSNIIVSTDDPCCIVALIDWHQSGWYPDYWEHCKAVFTAEPGGEWEAEYIPRFLEIPDCYDAWTFYPRTIGY